MADPIRLPLSAHLREALTRLEAAERSLREGAIAVIDRAVVQREIVSAATSVGRALHLIGEGR